MGLLTDKTAVVTGGSSGIGLPTAQRFVDEGATVIITGRRRAELDAAAANSVPASMLCPVTSPSQPILARLHEAAARLGGIDIVFANAGVGGGAPLGSITQEQADLSLDNGQFNAHRSQGIPLGGLPSTDQVAVPALFLASDLSSFTTG